MSAHKQMAESPELDHASRMATRVASNINRLRSSATTLVADLGREEPSRKITLDRVATLRYAIGLLNESLNVLEDSVRVVPLV
jgi:hypothetical protein